MNQRLLLTISVIAVLLTGCQNRTTEQASQAGATEAAASYKFERGYPAGDTAQKAYDAADLNRAIEAYRFFYPTVSGHAIFKENERLGIVPNKVFGTLEGQPKHVGFTYNSDTPYAPALMDCIHSVPRTPWAKIATAPTVMSL